MKHSTADVQLIHSEIFHEDLLPKIFATVDKLTAQRDQIIEQMKDDDEYFKAVVTEGLTYTSFASEIIGTLFDDEDAAAITVLSARDGKDVIHSVMEDVYSVYGGYLHLTECIAVIAEAHGLLPEVPYDDRGVFDYSEYLRRLEAKGQEEGSVLGPSDIVDKVAALAFEVTHA